MASTVFVPKPLPQALAAEIRTRLTVLHRTRPLSSVDPRETVRRVRGALEGLPLEFGVYRGGLDLRGAEVDHVWLGVRRVREEADEGWVIDASFPLFDARFVATLRRFIAGDAAADDLAAAARSAGVEERVLGVYPDPMRYRGQPVWAARERGEPPALEAATRDRSRPTR